MSQNKEALMAELQELRTELRKMRNVFDDDGVIDNQEQAILDEMQREINSIQDKIEDLEEEIIPEEDPKEHVLLKELNTIFSKLNL